MPVLYLFDIDGTMVDMTPAHVKAYKEAYKKVLGLDIAEKVLVRQFGQVEMEIHKAVFRHYRIKGLAKAKRIVNSYTTNITRALRTARINSLPGIKPMLNYLKKHKQPLGVVTGNSKEIGEAVLKTAGLYGYFDVYSYGNVSKRAHIVKKAIRAAKKRGIKFERSVVIGDAPFDVHAARKNNAIAVAVATGRYSLEELESEKPDLALRSLKGYKRLVSRIRKAVLVHHRVTA